VLLEIVNQLNRGAPLMATQDEREQLRQLHLVSTPCSVAATVRSRSGSRPWPRSGSSGRRVTEDTVKGRVKSILSKLDANDRTHAAIIGLREESASCRFHQLAALPAYPSPLTLKSHTHDPVGGFASRHHDA
jgi:hypothetical protein